MLRGPLLGSCYTAGRQLTETIRGVKILLYKTYSLRISCTKILDILKCSLRSIMLHRYRDYEYGHSKDVQWMCDICFTTPHSYCVLLLQEEFCFPVESLSLTVEEVMHIRQVLVKAELEKFQQYKDIYNAMKKGKVENLCNGFLIIMLFNCE